jgi:hypothetical protein
MLVTAFADVSYKLAASKFIRTNRKNVIPQKTRTLIKTAVGNLIPLARNPV